jgi:hypothetical protein
MASAPADFVKAAKRIEDLVRATGKSVPSGLRVIGEEIKTDVAASRRGAGVPRDMGDLGSSLRVLGPKDNVVTLASGGASAPYARYQHEMVGLNHRVGEARYWIRGAERWAQGGRPRAALKQMVDEALAAVGGR